MNCTYINAFDSDFRKRSGSDLVKSAVNSYLRRRHYMDADHLRKSDLIVSQTSKQMTIAATVDKDLSRANSIIYSVINNDIVLAEQQFTKLKSWIADLSEDKCRRELYGMLAPLFCHLYLENLKGGLDRLVLSKFLKKHQELFLVQDHCRDIIEEISSVFTTQDIDTKPTIRVFRSCKYHLEISSATMAALQKYLSSQTHVILLQVLQTWFDIEVVPGENSLDCDEDMTEITSNDENAEYLESLYQQPHDDKEMRHLQEAIRLVRASPTPSPPLLLYTMNNSENVCCTKVSRSGKLLASGYSSSSLKLWSLSEAKIYPPTSHYATIDLATKTPLQDRYIQEQRSSTLRGHCGPVTGVDYLYDAGILLSVSNDTTMRAWKLSDYSCASLYRGHNHPVWCVSASPLGVYVATGSHDSTARLWNLDRSYPLRIFSGHCSDVNCLQFHPNSTYLATGSADRSVRLWSVTDGSLVRVYGGSSGAILALAFSPNGQHLASAGDDRRVKVWDLASGGVLADLRGHSMPVTALDWSKDGSTLASASLDGTVLLWNSTIHFKPPVSENTENPAKYTSNCSSILSIQCLPRGNLVAVGTQ